MTLRLVPPPEQQAQIVAYRLKLNISRLRGLKGSGKTRQQMKPADHRQKVRFAHPAEAEFARVLNFYRVRWLYEPHQFPLEWHSDGSVARMFSPDFYLPEFNLYAELTTQKQSLVTRKNAKLRRLRELYPEVNIRLFYRKDMQRFLARFGVSVASHTITPPGGLAV